MANTSVSICIIYIVFGMALTGLQVHLIQEEFKKLWYIFAKKVKVEKEKVIRKIRLNVANIYSHQVIGFTCHDEDEDEDDDDYLI